MFHPLGAWCIGRSLGLDYTWGSRSCLIRVVHFTKMLCHDMDSSNTPGVSHAMSTASSSGLTQWSLALNPFFCSSKKKKKNLFQSLTALLGTCLWNAWWTAGFRTKNWKTSKPLTLWKSKQQKFHDELISHMHDMNIKSFKPKVSYLDNGRSNYEEVVFELQL